MNKIFMQGVAKQGEQIYNRRPSPSLFICAEGLESAHGRFSGLRQPLRCTDGVALAMVLKKCWGQRSRPFSDNQRMISAVRLKAAVRASGLHLVGSALVVALVAWMVFGLWYPYPYRELAGGLVLFGLVVVVDLVLGPLLTLVVFDRRKPRSELVRDLAVIGVLQLAALAYGLASVYQARPVYLVHEVDRFVVVSAADVDPADLPQALPEFQRLPFSGVRVVGVRDSKDSLERQYALELALAGKDVSMQPGYWQPLSEVNRAVMRQRAKPLSVLMNRSPQDRDALNRWLAEGQRSAGAFVSLPITARAQVWTAVLDVRTLEIVGYLPIDSF